MKRNRLLNIITVIAAATAVFSLYMIVTTLVNAEREQNAFDKLAAIVEQGKGQTDLPDRKPDSESVILPEYASLYEQNNDFFGWLRIDGTPVNYPVMHTPYAPQYYLHRAFDKSDAQSGTLFLDGSCFEGCGNYIIYGHHMKNNTMFGSLPDYADKEYWKQHKRIYFDSLFEHREYEVIAAFYGEAVAEGDPGFRYYQYTDLTDPVIFEEFAERVEDAVIYDTGLTAEYGDELITLSTCSYHTNDGRFAVVARRIEN